MDLPVGNSFTLWYTVDKNDSSVNITYIPWLTVKLVTCCHGNYKIF